MELRYSGCQDTNLMACKMCSMMILQAEDTTAPLNRSRPQVTARAPLVAGKRAGTWGEAQVIRVCQQNDIDTIYEIINDSARAYKGHIPEDRYHEPYMPMDQLLAEITDGVVFYGFEEDGLLVAVMGLQYKGPVILVRHAYTSTEKRGRGIGSSVLAHLRRPTRRWALPSRHGLR